MGKEYMKKTGEELQQYLQFRRRGSRVEAKKGKGARIIVIERKIRRASKKMSDISGSGQIW